MVRNTYVRKAQVVLRRMAAEHSQIALLRCEKRNRYSVHLVTLLPLRERRLQIHFESHSDERWLGCVSTQPLGSSAWALSTPNLQSRDRY